MDESMLSRLRQIQEMQLRLQQEVTAIKGEGTDEDKKVTIVFTGAGRFESIKLDPLLVGPDQKEKLQDAILVAAKDAITRVQTEAKSKFQADAQKLGISLPNQ
jgi:DNA-binding protein YbaB